MLVEAEQRSRSLVEGHLDVLHAVAKALFERDELNGDEVREIINSFTASDAP